MYDLKENISPETEIDLLPIIPEIENHEGETRQLNVLSLFSGCGGMDLGFEGGFTTHIKSINRKTCEHFVDEVLDEETVLLKKTNFKTVFANDILVDAKNAWVNYFSKRNQRNKNIFQNASIVDLVKLHQQGVNVFPDHVDVVTGGFPCQDFSVAGKRKGFDSHKNHNGELITNNVASEETRGKLYMWMKQVIEITQPNIFIAENVKGLVNLSNVKDIIQADFSSINGNGYLVLPPQVLHAADYGVPQSRERVIFIGIKKSALTPQALRALGRKQVSKTYTPYPVPTHGFTAKGKDLAQPVALRDIFAHLPEPQHAEDLAQRHYSRAKYMGKHCQGQTEVKLNGIAPTIRAEHHGNIEFRRLSAEHGGKLQDELAANLGERRLTPRECALIQTFPKDYEFVIPKPAGRKGSFLVSPSQAYKIIGNAVPPLLAYNIAKRIEQVWDLYFTRTP